MATISPRCLIDHASQYSYYALTALGFPLSIFIKRALTAIQIAQFVLGSLVSWIYFFVKYEVPFPAQSSISPAINLVEGSQTANASQRGYMGYELEHHTVSCLEHSGQAFGILLGNLFLVPLMCLFLRFFRQSYSRGKLDCK